MTDIFISYAREDEARIRELVHALEEKRWSIFWDRRIPTGKSWQSYIAQALSDARCVIVAWSHHSITSEWVIEEANDAKERGVLVPVLLEPVRPPLGFRGIQAADLTEWKRGCSSPYFDQLIQDIAGVVGDKPHRPSETNGSQTTPVPRSPNSVRDALAAYKYNFGWSGGPQLGTETFSPVTMVTFAPGGRVSLQYARPGTIEASLEERMLSGTWKDSDGEGELKLRFTTDFSHAEGWWKYKGQEEKYPALMKRFE